MHSSAWQLVTILWKDNMALHSNRQLSKEVVALAAERGVSLITKLKQAETIRWGSDWQISSSVAASHQNLSSLAHILLEAHVSNSTLVRFGNCMLTWRCTATGSSAKRWWSWPSS